MSKFQMYHVVTSPSGKVGLRPATRGVKPTIPDGWEFEGPYERAKANDIVASKTAGISAGPARRMR